MTKSTSIYYPGSVVKIIGDHTVVINRGSDHGISEGDSFLIYDIDPEEIVDPDTGENLGNLEIVRGTGIATHVQEKLTTISSNRTRITGRGSRQISLFTALSGHDEERIPIAFDDPQIGDYVKPI